MQSSEVSIKAPVFSKPARDLSKASKTKSSSNLTIRKDGISRVPLGSVTSTLTSSNNRQAAMLLKETLNKQTESTKLPGYLKNFDFEKKIEEKKRLIKQRKQMKEKAAPACPDISSTSSNNVTTKKQPIEEKKMKEVLASNTVLMMNEAKKVGLMRQESFESSMQTAQSSTSWNLKMPHDYVESDVNQSYETSFEEDSMISQTGAQIETENDVVPLKQDAQQIEAARLRVEAEQTETARLQAEAEQIEAARLQAEAEQIEAARLQAEAEQIEAARLQAETEQIEAARLQAETEQIEAARLQAEAEQIEAARLQAEEEVIALKKAEEEAAVLKKAEEEEALKKKKRAEEKAIERERAEKRALFQEDEREDTSTTQMEAAKDIRTSLSLTDLSSKLNSLVNFQYDSKKTSTNHPDVISPLPENQSEQVTLNEKIEISDDEVEVQAEDASLNEVAALNDECEIEKKLDVSLDENAATDDDTVAEEEEAPTGGVADFEYGDDDDDDDVEVSMLVSFSEDVEEEVQEAEQEDFENSDEETEEKTEDKMFTVTEKTVQIEEEEIELEQHVVVPLIESNSVVQKDEVMEDASIKEKVQMLAQKEIQLITEKFEQERIEHLKEIERIKEQARIEIENGQQRAMELVEEACESWHAENDLKLQQKLNDGDVRVKAVSQRLVQINEEKKTLEEENNILKNENKKILIQKQDIILKNKKEYDMFEKKLKLMEVNALSEREAAVSEVKERMRVAAEEQFAKAKLAYKSTKTSLQVSNDLNTKLENEIKNMKNNHEILMSKNDIKYNDLQSQHEELKKKLELTIKEKEEAMSICEASVEEISNLTALKDEAIASTELVMSERDKAYISLASATEEIMIKDNKICLLEQELKEARENCEELLALAEASTH